ncbi:MAG: tetratricopeptide repeat protein [Bacteroidetes bacterium]|nr:tetratricopeptide repeat protein [Bacteroidota bacterium]
MHSTFVLGKQSKLDSLKQIINSTAEDSTRVIAKTKTSNLLLNTDVDAAYKEAYEALQLSEKIEFKKGVRIATQAMAEAFLYKGDYKSSLNYYNKVIKLCYDNNTIESLVSAQTGVADVYMNEGNYDKAIQTLNYILSNYKEIITTNQKIICYNYLASSYYYKSDYQNALSNYIQSANIAEQTKDKAAQSQGLLNIGNIYLAQKLYTNAQKYYQEALKLNKEIKDERDIALCYNNIGLTYQHLNEYDKALENHFMSLELKKKLNDRKGVAKSLNNIGAIYTIKQKYDEALKLYNEAIEIHEEIGNASGVAKMQLNIGSTLIKKGKSSQAFNYLEKSLVYFKEINNKDLQQRCYEELSTAAYTAGDYKKSYQYLEKSVALKDSIYEEENASIIAEMQTKYDTDKKEKEIALLTTEQELKNSKIKQQLYINIGIAILLLAALLGGAFIFRNYKQKQKINVQLAETIIKQQLTEEELRHKNDDITASIKYAKKIQEAILPKTEKISEILPESFILYKPKDIVSGDFYWFYDKNEVYSFIAAADCTGHGVPGAFMSMIGNNILNQIVGESVVTNPSFILNNLHDEITKALKQNIPGSESRDGMDIALCRINKRTKQIDFAGANRPLYVIKNNILSEIAPTKQPIGGGHIERVPFVNQTLQMEKGDIVYMSSDGYADQFGGALGKKYMTKNFKRFISEIAYLPMPIQKEKLNNEIEEWKGDKEQIDDILVIGVKFS